MAYTPINYKYLPLLLLHFSVTLDHNDISACTLNHSVTTGSPAEVASRIIVMTVFQLADLQIMVTDQEKLNRFKKPDQGTNN